MPCARFRPPSAAGGGLGQDEEWCEIGLDGARTRIRLNDYATIFDVPGLYEHLFTEILECSSPEVVCGLLQRGGSGFRVPDTGGVAPAGEARRVEFLSEQSELGLVAGDQGDTEAFGSEAAGEGCPEADTRVEESDNRHNVLPRK